ncbi:MAG: HAD-IIIA family hydrolase [Candidatus Omnitrophica bacterium]|nr:HAD-IIIA family hydrolase [Candidatus Omnitrophota bacterium]
MSFLLSMAYLMVIGSFTLYIVADVLKYKCSLIEFVSLSFFLGLAVVTVSFPAFNFLGVDLKNIKWVLYCSLFIAGLYFLRSKKNFTGLFSRYFAAPGKARIGLTVPEILLLSGIAIELLWVVFLAWSYPVDSHDALAGYALKAKMFYSAGSIPPGFFGYTEGMVAHPDYPLFLPFLMTWVYEFTGFNDCTVQLVMPVTYFFTLTLYYSVARKRFDRLFSIGAVFFIATVPQVADYAAFINADYFLFAFVGAAFMYLSFYGRGNDKGYLVLSSALFGLSVWIKNEGIVFAVSALLALLARMLLYPEKGKGSKDMLWLLGGIAAIALPWFAFKKFMGVMNNDINPSDYSMSVLWTNFRDLPILLDFLQRQVFGPKKWNLFWMIFWTLVILKRRDLLRKERIIQTVFILLASLGYFAGYMAMTGTNLYFYANTTISRFMLHFAGISMFYMALLAYGDLSRRKFVFIDRDGVINVDGKGRTPSGYVMEAAHLAFVPGTLEALKDLKEAGYQSVVISNQQCVGKGLCSMADLEALTAKMLEGVRARGGDIAGIFYCTHHKDEHCGCHKPAPGLIYKAAGELSIGDLGECYFIGDSERDVVAAKRAGVKSILVRSGISSEGEEEKWEIKPDRVFNDLKEASGFILGKK